MLSDISEKTKFSAFAQIQLYERDLRQNGALKLGKQVSSWLAADRLANYC